MKGLGEAWMLGSHELGNRNLMKLTNFRCFMQHPCPNMHNDTGNDNDQGSDEGNDMAR